MPDFKEDGSSPINIPEVVEKINATLKESGRAAKVDSIEEKSPGKYSITMRTNELAMLERNQAIKEHASTIYRDAVNKTNLDLPAKAVTDLKPQELVTRSIQAYYNQDVYGSYIDALVNFTVKGFKNDCDDRDVKYFFDSWFSGVGLRSIMRQVVTDLFRVGYVCTYRIKGKYEPKIGTLPIEPNTKNRNPTSEEQAMRLYGAKKNTWSKAFIPIRYRVLNPLSYEILPSSVFVGTQKIKMKASSLKDLSELLKKSDLSPEEKEYIKGLPTDLKNAAKNNKDIILDETSVSIINYRKMDYETYSKPKGARALASLDFKSHLVNADYSTLDGATSYILVITVGNDTYPVTNSTTLEKVSALFDTPSKSFDVVWNHTLKVEKLTTPELAQILGEDKYRQVTKDISGGMSMPRAILDGSEVLNAATADTSVKNVIEEVNYVRDEVRDWLYNEYRQIAEALNLPVFPSVRWDNFILRNDMEIKKMLQGFADRRIVSYQTIVDELGYNYDNELAQMKEEVNLVTDGVFGIIGSPYQQQGFSKPAVQDTQRAPAGTPSEGRPKGKQQKVASLEDEAVDATVDSIGGVEMLDLAAQIATKLTQLSDEDKTNLMKKIKTIIED